MSASPFLPILTEVLTQNEALFDAPLPKETIEKLALLCDYLLEINAHLNLTAITEAREIAVKHIADSLSLSRYLPQNATVLDVGCGAGFPSLPLAIARPDLCITALDSTAKKLTFVQNAAQKCGALNLKILCGRAEELAQTDLRASFDVVTARAVAAMPVLAELCIPFVKKNGLWIAPKGANALCEWEEAKKAVHILGAKLQKSEPIDLKGGTEVQNHHIFVFQKTTESPAIYPRNFSQIRKKPL